jgi:hypothetical protein
MPSAILQMRFLAAAQLRQPGGKIVDALRSLSECAEPRTFSRIIKAPPDNGPNGEGRAI